jgi:hypothetical protein
MTGTSLRTAKRCFENLWEPVSLVKQWYRGGRLEEGTLKKRDASSLEDHLLY